VDQVKFRLRGSSDAAVNALLDRIMAGIKGQRVTDLERLRADVLAGILPRIYPQMMRVVRDHQDAGLRCYIVSAASQEMVGTLAEVLAMDGAIGTPSEVVDGVYTGRLAGPFAYGEGKATALAEFAAAEGIDLRRSWAYSDSVSDLPMLQAVGNPVAVNPDAELEEIARREGWETYRFDKLRQRLRIAGTTLAAGAVAATAAWVAGEWSQRERQRRRTPWARVRG
jgi:HAD superfamily hydrolase (TIGR01490 family)